MAHLAPNYEERQEFWKPAVAPRQEAASAETTDQVCQECGTDFVLGSRFCSVCTANIAKARSQNKVRTALLTHLICRLSRCRFLPRSYRWFPELLPFLIIWCQMCHLGTPISSPYKGKSSAKDE